MSLPRPADSHLRQLSTLRDMPRVQPWQRASPVSHFHRATLTAAESGRQVKRSISTARGISPANADVNHNAPQMLHGTSLVRSQQTQHGSTHSRAAATRSSPHFAAATNGNTSPAPDVSLPRAQPESKGEGREDKRQHREQYEASAGPPESASTGERGNASLESALAAVRSRLVFAESEKKEQEALVAALQKELRNQGVRN